MDNLREQHCRLCLSTVSVEHFNEIEDLTKSLDVRFLKLNLDNSSRYIMCNVCTWKVMEASRFKSMCVNTNNTIIPYVDETGCCVDLKEIYMKQTGTKHLMPTVKDYKVCRLCMQLIKDKFIPAYEMAADMIEMYIPEIDLTVIQDPVICKQCFDSFVSHSNFIKNCLEVNEEIKSFWFPEVVDNSIWIPTIDSLIKTEEMDIKSEREQEDELPVTNSTVVGSIYKGISNTTNQMEIKTEDNEEKSEAALVTDNVSTDVVNQYNPSQDNEYFATRSTSTLSHCLVSHQDTCDTSDFKTKHTDISEIKGFNCDTCSFKTKYRKNLKCHQVTHKDISETKVFECDTCDYKSKFKYYLKRHQLTHKDISEMEVFECDTCDYKAKCKNRLKKHQLVHKDISEIEGFECDICGYKTKYKYGLKKHQLTHQDISEMNGFACDTCDYKTKIKGNLKKHQLKHKDISETEAFQCDTCDFKTKHKSSIKLHLLTHVNISETKVFACDTCDYRTKRKDNLKNHQLTHKDISEMEIFECDACDFKTKHRSSIKHHLLTHKGICKVEVFPCDICGFKTKHKRNLKRHLQTHRNFSETSN